MTTPSSVAIATWGIVLGIGLAMLIGAVPVFIDERQVRISVGGEWSACRLRPNRNRDASRLAKKLKQPSGRWRVPVEHVLRIAGTMAIGWPIFVSIR